MRAVRHGMTRVIGTKPGHMKGAKSPAPVGVKEDKDLRQAMAFKAREDYEAGRRARAEARSRL